MEVVFFFIEIHIPIPINPYPWSIPRAYTAVTRESRCHRESLVRTWLVRHRSCPAGSVSSSNFRIPPLFPLPWITFQISVGQFWLRLISSSIHILTTTKRTKCESSKLKKTYRVWVFIRSMPKSIPRFNVLNALVPKARLAGWISPWPAGYVASRLDIIIWLVKWISGNP